MRSILLSILACSLLLNVTAKDPRKPHLRKVSSRSDSHFKNELIKPLEGTLFEYWQEDIEEWMSERDFTLRYDKDGNIIEETYLDGQGRPTDATEFEYDRLGLVDATRRYEYRNGEKTLVQTVENRHTYDSEGRITRVDFHAYTDQGSLSRYYTSYRYTADSLIVEYFSYNGDFYLDYYELYSQKTGENQYGKFEGYTLENGVATRDFLATNVTWHKLDFARDIFQITYADVESEEGEGRLTGSYSSTLYTELFEVKTELLYVPESRYTERLDAKGNTVEITYEGSYNAVTSSFDEYFKERYTRTYDNDNLLSVLAEQASTPDAPQYANRYLQTFRNFQVINAIGETKAELVGVFPNPTTGIIHFQANTPIQRIVIKDLSGKTVETRANVSDMDISSLPEGVYFITVSTDAGDAHKKVVRTR